MPLLDGSYLRGGEVVRVPEDVEPTVGWNWGVGGVVYCKGEDEVEFNSRVDGDIGEPDAIELGSDVFSEEIGLGSRCWCEKEEEEEEEGREEVWGSHLKTK